MATVGTDTDPLDNPSHPDHHQALQDGKLDKSGGTITGDVTIRKASAVFVVDATSGVSRVALKGIAGTTRDVVGYTGSVPRWILRLGDSSAETGGSAGSNLFLYAYDDAATTSIVALRIYRNTGLGTVVGPPTTALGIATKGYVDTPLLALLDALAGTLPADTLDAVRALLPPSQDPEPEPVG